LYYLQAAIQSCLEVAVLLEPLSIRAREDWGMHDKVMKAVLGHSRDMKTDVAARIRAASVLLNCSKATLHSLRLGRKVVSARQPRPVYPFGLPKPTSSIAQENIWQLRLPKYVLVLK
jgi:hypothetical protein